MSEETKGAASEAAEASASAAAAAEAAAGAAKPETKSKIRVNGHEFDSVEDLTKWASTLETSVGRQGQELGLLRDRIERSSPKSKESAGSDMTSVLKRAGEILFDNPEEALKLVAEQAKAEAKREATAEFRQASAQDAAEAARWEEYFRLNPKHARFREKIISYAYGPLWTELEGKSKAEQFEKIRAAWDRDIEELAAASGATEMPGRKPVAETGSSPSGAAPGRERTEAKKPKTFLDDLTDATYHPKLKF